MSTGVNFQLSSFCIIGAGAIGGLLGINLALDAKADVTLIARGTHLKAIQSNGLRLIRPDGTERLWENVKATDDLDSLEGDFDVIIIAVKSHQVELIAHKIERLCHKNTIIVTIQNGLPWYCSIYTCIALFTCTTLTVSKCTANPGHCSHFRNFVSCNDCK
mmetsp:Transcript_24261/g.29594  ORF Transcript_24261/g.29594 Transcript_24261/m.29594 type:complete len:161 (+) Transcript_24261:189-671(+)